MGRSRERAELEQGICWAGRKGSEASLFLLLGGLFLELFDGVEKRAGGAGGGYQLGTGFSGARGGVLELFDGAEKGGGAELVQVSGELIEGARAKK